MGAVRATLMVLAVVAFFYAVPAVSGSPRAYGRELVAQHRLPAEAIARYAALATDSQSYDGSRERAVWQDELLWVGPAQQAGVGRNPYTLVLTVHGVAKAAGDIRTQWRTGWEVRESPVATREVSMPLAGLSSTAAVAGTPVSLTAIGTPVSFRGERNVAPTVNLIAAQNIEISDVDLQVWSGSAPIVAWPTLAAPRPALLGLGALCLLGWFVLTRAARPAALRAPAAKPTPEADVQELLAHRAAEERPLPPVPLAPLPAPDHAARVVASLRDVLSAGLTVPTVFDERRADLRRSQRRRA